ncbi:MAG: YafY family transcriptional regulator [Turicibacter sp.]|nr:YafY family transcriptional regulator [Turicibacter sp.]
MKANRLFEIVYYLLNKKVVTADELAKRFEVSVRTIYRDIDAISLAGIPIYTEQGRTGGISLLPDFVMDKSILSEKEQHDVLANLQGLFQLSSDETALQKLSATFNKTAINWLEVDFSWNEDQKNYFRDLKAGILERRVIRFDYFSSHNEKTNRCVEPIQLWFKHRAWYLRGYCLMRQGVRLFKLIRMKDLKVTEQLFEERYRACDLKEVSSREDEEHDVRLRLKIAPEMAHRVLDEFDFEEEVEEQNGYFIVSTTWKDNEILYGFILSFGEYIEVLAPSSVRALIKKRAQMVVDKY